MTSYIPRKKVSPSGNRTIYKMYVTEMPLLNQFVLKSIIKF